MDGFRTFSFAIGLLFLSSAGEIPPPPPHTLRLSLPQSARRFPLWHGRCVFDLARIVSKENGPAPAVFAELAFVASFPFSFFYVYSSCRPFQRAGAISPRRFAQNSLVVFSLRTVVFYFVIFPSFFY